MTKCRDCGTSIPPDDTYCADCLPNVCRMCCSIPPDDKYCDDCCCPNCGCSSDGGLCGDCQDIVDAADERRDELRDQEGVDEVAYDAI